MRSVLFVALLCLAAAAALHAEPAAAPIPQKAEELVTQETVAPPVAPGSQDEPAVEGGCARRSAPEPTPKPEVDQTPTEVPALPSGPVVLQPVMGADGVDVNTEGVEVPAAPAAEAPKAEEEPKAEADAKAPATTFHTTGERFHTYGTSSRPDEPQCDRKYQVDATTGTMDAQESADHKEESATVEAEEAAAAAEEAAATNEEDEEKEADAPGHPDNISDEPEEPLPLEPTVPTPVCGAVHSEQIHSPVVPCNKTEAPTADEVHHKDDVVELTEEQKCAQASRSHDNATDEIVVIPEKADDPTPPETAASRADAVEVDVDDSLE